MNNSNPMQDIFIGIDGGATKTIARVEDAHGELLGQGQGGPANIRLSVEGSWQSIHDALREALVKPGLRLDDGRLRFYCGAGLAGTEVTSACDQFVNTPHPFARLILKSDGYTSCLGAHGGGDGAMIAIGTGTVGYEIEADKEYKVGGWGFPHGDEGSGALLGLEAVRLTLHWLDGRGEPSRPEPIGGLGQSGKCHPIRPDCAYRHRAGEASDAPRCDPDSASRAGDRPACGSAGRPKHR